MNLKRCFQPSSQTNAGSIALLCLRLVAGIGMMMHGWGKIQTPMSWMGPDSPIPGILQFLAAFSEFGGGIAWILGLVTPLASLGMLFTMAFATFFHAVVQGDPFVSKGGASYEMAALYLMISLVLMLVGPGKISADKIAFGEK